MAVGQKLEEARNRKGISIREADDVADFLEEQASERYDEFKRMRQRVETKISVTHELRDLVVPRLYRIKNFRLEKRRSILKISNSRDILETLCLVLDCYGD